MKIMGFDFKKIRSSSFRDKQKSAESQDLNKVALRQVVRKQVGLQDRKNEHTRNFPSIEIS